MPFRHRGSLTIWPIPKVQINWSRRTFLSFPHYTSTSVTFWRWGWNSRTRKQHLDTPGGGWWESR